MPRGDGTGPLGAGPMTGRAAGYCAGFDMPGYANPIPGRGMGMGFGRGRGFAGPGRGGGRGFGGGGRGHRHWFYATGMPGWMRVGASGAYGGYGVPYGPFPNPDPEMEKQALKNQAEALQSEIDVIKKRLAEIESGAAEESA